MSSALQTLNKCVESVGSHKLDVMLAALNILFHLSLKQSF